jgi:hypothetical protein
VISILENAGIMQTLSINLFYVTIPIEWIICKIMIKEEFIISLMSHCGVLYVLNRNAYVVCIVLYHE